MDLFETVQGKIVIWIILASSIALHEWGHAYSADKLGDPLPRSQGRVTLNPLAHIDILGTVIIPLIMLLAPTGGFTMIGWGKPVQVSLPNPKTRKRDDMIITACGPLVNLAIALGCAILGGLLFRLGLNDYAKVCYVAIIMNVSLFVFNLIPIPPLDGSHFLKYAVNMSEETYTTLSQWGFIILLVFINFGPTSAIMGKVIQVVCIPFKFLLERIAGA